MSGGFPALVDEIHAEAQAAARELDSAKDRLHHMESEYAQRRTELLREIAALEARLDERLKMVDRMRHMKSRAPRSSTRSGASADVGSIDHRRIKRGVSNGWRQILEDMPKAPAEGVPIASVYDIARRYLNEVKESNIRSQMHQLKMRGVVENVDRRWRVRSESEPPASENGETASSVASSPDTEPLPLSGGKGSEWSGA